jgi:HSP20 family protein
MKEMVSLKQAMDRLFEDSFVSPSKLFAGTDGEAFVPVDMYETEKDVVVKMSLPGVSPDDVDITVQGDVLTVKGETKEEKKEEKKGYIFQERRYGSFSRAVTLPEGLKTGEAEATLENGVLTLRIPRSEEVKPKQIKIKAGPEAKK